MVTKNINTYQNKRHKQIIMVFLRIFFQKKKYRNKTKLQKIKQIFKMLKIDNNIARTYKENKIKKSSARLILDHLMHQTVQISSYKTISQPSKINK